jgi:hypothetical protein
MKVLFSCAGRHNLVLRADDIAYRIGSAAVCPAERAAPPAAGFA